MEIFSTLLKAFIKGRELDNGKSKYSSHISFNYVFISFQNICRNAINLKYIWIVVIQLYNQHEALNVYIMTVSAFFELWLHNLFHFLFNQSLLRFVLSSYKKPCFLSLAFLGMHALHTQLFSIHLLCFNLIIIS